MRLLQKYLCLPRSLFLATAILAVSPLVTKAVLVSPHALFIDHHTRTAQFTLANSSEQAEEVEIALRFGFPETDSLGNPYVKLIEDPGAEFPSAADWIRAFPRRVRLDPGQRQVVRFLATPPEDLEDREYWSRVIVTSRRSEPLRATADTAVRIGLTFEMRTILALMYRKGRVHTGVELHDLRAAATDDTLEVWLALKREGNAAFLGSARFTLLDGSGNTVRHWQTALAVYYSLNRRLRLPLDQVQAGRYRLHVELSTAREDIPATRVLPTPTIDRTLEIDVG